FPGDFWINQRLGLVFLGMKPAKPADAVTYLTVAVALRPHSAGAHLNLGNALKDNGDLQGALDQYGKAIELKNDYVAAWNYRGLAYHLLARYDQAITDLTHAIQLKKDFAEAWNNRGNAYANLGKHEQAIADYTQAQ